MVMNMVSSIKGARRGTLQDILVYCCVSMILEPNQTRATSRLVVRQGDIQSGITVHTVRLLLLLLLVGHGSRMGKSESISLHFIALCSW